MQPVLRKLFKGWGSPSVDGVRIPTKSTTHSDEVDHPPEKLDRRGLLGLKVVGLRRTAGRYYWHPSGEASATIATGGAALSGRLLSRFGNHKFFHPSLGRARAYRRGEGVKAPAENAVGEDARVCTATAYREGHPLSTGIRWASRETWLIFGEQKWLNSHERRRRGHQVDTGLYRVETLPSAEPPRSSRSPSQVRKGRLFWLFQQFWW